MNKHKTCEACMWNVDSHCACEDGRYKGCAVKSWNTCSQHKAPAQIAVKAVVG